MPFVNDEFKGNWGDSSDKFFENEAREQCSNCGEPCTTIVRGKFGSIYCSSRCKREHEREKG